MSSSVAVQGSERPRRGAGMAWQTIDGETVLLDISGRELCGVNEVAARIWALCDGEHSVDQIAATVAGEFAVAPEVAAADARAFIGELLASGALEL